MRKTVIVHLVCGAQKRGVTLMASKNWTWASIQSEGALVQLVCAKLKLKTPSTAAKICALRTSPVNGHAVSA